MRREMPAESSGCGVPFIRRPNATTFKASEVLAEAFGMADSRLPKLSMQVLVLARLYRQPQGWNIVAIGYGCRRLDRPCRRIPRAIQEAREDVIIAGMVAQIGVREIESCENIPRDGEAARRFRHA